MKITVRSFAGIRPGTAPDLLQGGEAVVASNVVLQGGDLDPLRAASQVVALTNSAAPIKSIYRFGQGLASDTQYWFQSTGEANFVKGPIDGDTAERTYFTGHTNNFPAKTREDVAHTSAPYPSLAIPMGLYVPAAAPSAVVSGDATDPESVAESVAYACTLVSSWGEESALSTASPVYSWRAGQTLTVTLPTSGTPSYPGNATKSGQTYTGKRLYRSATGASGTAKWLLVNTEGIIPLATSTYVDTKVTASLGEAATTKGWVEPPDDMKGLTQMANGVLAGYSGATICFCEPFYPYAWPVRYQQSVDAPVVGIAAFGQSLVVSTTRSLYLFTGADPASMTSERLPDPQICIAKRAMVPMMGGVIFPTPDGLGYVGPGGFKMISDGLITRREWVAYTTAPDTMHAYEIDGRYVLFYNNGTGGALVFKFGEDATLSTTTVYATAGFRDPGRDALFLCVSGGGSVYNVQKWDAGAALSMTWTSGVFRLPSPANLGAARVDAAGTVNFELLADGAVVAGPYAVANSFPFKLPSGFRSQRYQVRITGSNLVRAVEVGDTVKAIISE